MNKIAAIEISNAGDITHLSTEDISFWENLLPTIGSTLFSFADESINTKLKDLTKQLFSKGLPIKYSLTINNQLVNFTAIRTTETIGFLCCEVEIPPENVDENVNPVTTTATTSHQTIELFESHPLNIDNTLKRFTDNLPLVVFEIHLYPDGKFEFGFVSKEMENFFPSFNRTAVNADNSLLFVRVHPEDKQKLMDSINNVFKFKIWDVEYRIVEKGKIKWVKGFGRPENKDNHITVCTYLQDITNYKNYEETINTERTLLRTLVDNLPVSIFVKDEKGRKIIANKLDVTYMGLHSEKEALGKTDLEIFANNKGNWGYKQDLLVLSSGNPIIDEEGELLYKNGNKRDIIVSKIPIKDENGKTTRLIGICRDVTEVKKLEQRLKMVDYAFLKANIAIFFTKEDGSFFDFNDAACKSLGYAREELMRLKVPDIDPNFPTEIWNAHWKEMNTREARVLISKHKRKDGTLIDVEINQNTIKHLGQELHCTFITDITEKKKLEKQLSLVSHGFHQVSMPMVFLQEDGTFLEYNPATPKMLRYNLEEFKGKTVFDINPNLTKESWAARWADLRKKPNQTLITNFKRRDGSIIDIEVRTSLIKIDDIEVNFGFYTDITEKKKLEDQLKLSEEKYRYLFENIPYPMLIWEFGTLKILDANSAAMNLYGYTKEEFTQLNIKQIRPEEDIPLIEAATKNVESYGVDHHRIWRHKKKNGELMYIEVSAHVFELNGKKVSINHNQDVTEKLKAEKAIVESEKRYSDLFYYSPLPKWLFDPETFRFLQVNKAAIETYGYTAEEFLSMTIFDIRPEEDIQEVHHALRRTVGQKGVYVGEFMHRKKSGELIDVEIYSNTISVDGKDFILIVANDITEKKKQEERLLEIEKVVTETSQSVVIADADENLDTPILYANAAFTNITGYTLEEAKGMNPRILHKEMDVNDDNGRAIMRSAIKHFVPWKVVVLNKKKNGEHYWAEISGFPLFDKKKGRYTRWVAMQTDITDRKNAEEEKEKLLNELVENNKELTHFSYIVSHNLRAPLTNLVSISNLIRTEKIEDERTRKLIEGFKISTSFLNETLNDLIKVLIIKENPNWSKDNIVFQEVFNKVKAAIDFKLVDLAATVKVDFSEAPSVVFSKEYMESIFLNLMTNALRYSHPARYPLITIKTNLDANKNVKLVFADNGIGMDIERVRNKIFGLYQRFHTNSEGKGMGLYLVHSQVTALGGKIEVDSQEGVGTTFTITFK